MPDRHPPSVLAVFAHPDDETFAAGGLLARLAHAGIPTHLIVATSGERGWKGARRPHPRQIARVREAELRAAADILGVRSVRVLGLPDGGVEEAPGQPLIRAIATHLRDLRPDAVLTFGPEGITGHPDHIAVSKRVTAALVEAAGSPSLPLRPHRVASLWHVGFTAAQRDAYERLIGPVAWSREDPPRRPAPWELWRCTLAIDTGAFVSVVRAAVASHASQLRDRDPRLEAPPTCWHAAFGRVTLSLAMTLSEGRDPMAELDEAIPSTDAAASAGSAAMGG
jgi:LmbE family N-acetylglucosaminyl deacetylase